MVIDAIAIVRGAPHEDEAKRFYEFVTTSESLIHSARNYYRIPLRSDLDRQRLPEWMSVPFTRMPLDWDVLRKHGMTGCVIGIPRFAAGKKLARYDFLRPLAAIQPNSPIYRSQSLRQNLLEIPKLSAKL